MGCGLPSWVDLVSVAYELAGVTLAAGIRPQQAAENLASQLPGGPAEFSLLVGKALYSVRNSKTGALEPFDESLVLKNQLLSAISAIVMLSCRRGHGTVVTYNFDDLLETYVAERGLFGRP